jgi:hypothetical protein
MLVVLIAAAAPLHAGKKLTVNSWILCDFATLVHFEVPLFSFDLTKI